MSAAAMKTDATREPIDERVEAYRLLIADVLELAGLSRASSDGMARQLGQTVARWHLMSVLSDGPRSVASAARRLGLARQSVQRVANDLVEQGLAISLPDPKDARAPLFELSPTGHDLVTELFARSEADRQDLVASAGLSARALLDAKSTIRALIDSIDRSRPSRWRPIARCLM